MSILSSTTSSIESTQLASNLDPESGNFAALLWQRRWHLIVGAVLGGALAAGASFLIPPTFTGRTSFLPPQPPQNAATSALASLGALAGAATSARTTGDQYLALLQSVSLRDRLIERFQLQAVYDEELRVDARIELSENTKLSLGRKDGILTVEVDDKDPQRAADLANAYVEELQRMSNGLALTEAQQRRKFFEEQLSEVKQRLAQAQRQLQAVGVSANTIKAEPKATAEAYSRLRAELTGAELRLQALRSGLADETPEVQRQAVMVAGLRNDLRKLETQNKDGGDTDYISAYRELRYHETLFEVIARQYETAKVDESRDGGQLQLIDKAEAPERKSKPRRSLVALLGVALGVICAVALALRQARRNPSH